jgi:pimeloyl-ACP methyl ester carboxylesterase
MTHDPHLPPETDHQFTLGDGRRLGYALLGESGGPVIVVLDGPGSRGLARAAAGAATALGLSLLAVDRPGFGWSTPAPRQSIDDVAHDVLALVDALGVRRFGLLGQSGGTPYALGVAALAGDRVVGLSTVGAVTPLGERGALEDTSGPMRSMFRVARRAPWLLRPMLGAVARQTRRDPAAVARKYAEGLPAADRVVLEDPVMWAIHERSSAEAVASPAAFAREVRRLTKPWGIDLDAITAPAALWAGDEDGTHPPVMSRRLAERLGEPPVTVVHGAGALGLVAVYADALHHAAGLGRVATAA